MVKAGTTVRAREIMYKAVVQTVLIYGNGSWVVINPILQSVSVDCRDKNFESRGGVMGLVISGRGLECSGPVANEGIYFRGGRLKLWSIPQIAPSMNYALRRRGFQDIAGSYSVGIRILPDIKKATEPSRYRRGR